MRASLSRKKCIAFQRTHSLIPLLSIRLLNVQTSQMSPKLPSHVATSSDQEPSDIGTMQIDDPAPTSLTATFSHILVSNTQSSSFTMTNYTIDKEIDLRS